MKAYKYTLALAIAAGITFGGLRPAHGELVFEDELNEASESAPAPVTKRANERSDLSKSETMRRQRLREELKNEDLLTQKLEELRLKDEMKRTGELLGSGINKEEVQVVVEPVQEQRIGTAAAPVAPVSMQSNPEITNVSMNGAPVGTSSADMSMDAGADDEDKNTRLSVTPRGGLTGISGSMYDVESKYSFGLSISADMSDHLAFVAGYTYSSYSVGAGTTLSYFNPQQMQKIEFNDNLFDIGARGYLFGLKSKVRPFAGGGFGYRKGYVNYDKATRDYLRQYNQYGAQDVNVSGFATYLELGVEFKLSKSISLVGMGRYFHMLSSRQSSEVNPNAFYNGGVAGYPYYGAATTGGAYYGNGYAYNDGSRERAGNDLSQANFFQLMAGISVSF